MYTLISIEMWVCFLFVIQLVKLIMRVELVDDDGSYTSEQVNPYISSIITSTIPPIKGIYSLARWSHRCIFSLLTWYLYIDTYILSMYIVGNDAMEGFHMYYCKYCSKHALLIGNQQAHASSRHSHTLVLVRFACFLQLPICLICHRTICSVY